MPFGIDFKFWQPFSHRFRVLGCPICGCFWGSTFSSFVWILHQKWIPKCDQIRDRVPGRGDPCPRRDRELQIHNLLNYFSLFLTSPSDPCAAKTPTKLWKSHFLRSSHNPSQYRMTSIYGLTYKIKTARKLDPILSFAPRQRPENLFRKLFPASVAHFSGIYIYIYMCMYICLYLNR